MRCFHLIVSIIPRIKHMPGMSPVLQATAISP